MLELCIQDRNSCLIELCILYPVHNRLNTRRRAHKRLECQEYDAGTAPLRAALQHPPHLQGFNWCAGGACHCLFEPWAHTQRLMSAHFGPSQALHCTRALSSNVIILLGCSFLLIRNSVMSI